ncbi:hypothetical protein R5R35_003831 [Gryllus longicercus]|uniref:Coiled-coil domain-containing protein 177 n=2 Tax=Gryllus longicercus TaxID=2509291 RepID=A0AAN9VRA7_9ORTH
MRTKPVDEPLHLNLYNFENSAAKDSPYVLTSPRSLEACRKAGCKPVELLHKSIEEYQEDLGSLAPAEVYQLYQNEERHRLNKLETCRAIRRELMTPGGSTPMKENAPPYTDISKEQLNFDSITRKDLLDKENLSRASVKQISDNIVLKSQENKEKTEKSNDSDSAINGTPTPTPSPQSWNKVLYLTGGGEEETVSSSSSKKKPSSPPPRAFHVGRAKRSLPRSCLNRKISLNAKSSPVPTCSFSRPGSVSSNSSTLSSLSNSAFKSARKLNTCSREHTRYVHPKLPRPESKSLPLSASTIKRRKGSSVLSLTDSSRKGNSPECGLNRNYDSNNNSSRESRLSSASAIFSRRKHVSFGYLSPDDLGLSEHDRRILESMALKKELERECDEFAHQAHILWEQDREIREQLNQEHAQKWKEYVAEKRRIENAENTRKWEEMKKSLRKSQQLLEQNIREKEEHAAQRKKSIDEKKLNAAGERGLVAAKRRAEVEAAHQLMELETALWQQAIDEQQRQRLEKAECTRLQQKETYRRRVASTNRVEELRHQERWLQVKEETEAALVALRQLCRQREKRAQERYQQLLQDRDRHIKTQSLERAIKFQQVRELHDELEIGLEKWQEQVLALQWEATQKAERNASRNVESKRQRVEMENRARRQHHSKLMERISREDEARVRYIRELIMQKEAKMKRMAQERDLAIRESRLQAQTTADLREHLRRTLSPETFDRKVARVALEMRVAGRPPTASPTMTRSHIFLG